MVRSGSLVAVGAVLAAAPADGQELAPLLDVRARYEHVEQADLPQDSDALILRVRAGASATSGPWSALVEGQALYAVVDHYNDGLHGPATRPLIADPENIALYRAQVQYRSDAVLLTVGRQRIALDDERFVGNVAFRANAQTFDAVRAEITPAAEVKADLTYSWDVRTIWGIEGTGARPQSVRGDKIFVNLSWDSPAGKLTGFAYLIDQDDPAVQGYRLSSQSYGLRLAGIQPVGGGWSLAYQLSHALQKNWRNNPNDYRAGYWLADAAAENGGWRLGGGYEVLGANDKSGAGAPLTSFQTPLGTNFKFQGWADEFLTTPPDGLRDLYVYGQHSFGRVGPVEGLALQATWHWFRSDRQDRPYGRELDLLATATLRDTLLSLRYAHYDAQNWASDTDKFWLQLDWTM